MHSQASSRNKGLEGNATEVLQTGRNQNGSCHGIKDISKKEDTDISGPAVENAHGEIDYKKSSGFASHVKKRRKTEQSLSLQQRNLSISNGNTCLSLWSGRTNLTLVARTWW